ncbi:MAG: thioredoxin domain-containing protein [Chthoniobacterales bacterium]
MKRLLPFAFILLIAVLAVGGGVALYRAKREKIFAPIPGELETSTPGAVPPHFRGTARAPIVLEEFGDLQCPPCAMLASFLKKLEQEHHGRIRLVFRNFPLAMHKHAVDAARAAEAAGAQDRYWEMSDMIYENQATWSKEERVEPIFEQYAQKIGLNLARFKADRDSQEILARIGLDNQRGASLGVKATPTLFINNQRVPQQFMNDNGLREAIDNLEKGKPPFPAS